MIAELAAAIFFTSPPAILPAREPRPPLPKVPARIHIDYGTWANSGDTRIPGWVEQAGNRRIQLRPETFRALRDRCGRRARALATFVTWHEAAHAIGIVSEADANTFAYHKISPRLAKLLPPYGKLLSGWIQLRPLCLQ